MFSGAGVQAYVLALFLDRLPNVKTPCSRTLILDAFIRLAVCIPSEEGNIRYEGASVGGFSAFLL